MKDRILFSFFCFHVLLQTVIIQGKKQFRIPSLSRFLRKIQAERSEVWRFSAKPAKRLDLVEEKGYGITFADG
jgi:hypothetical protein